MSSATKITCDDVWFDAFHAVCEESDSALKNYARHIDPAIYALIVKFFQVYGTATETINSIIADIADDREFMAVRMCK